MESLRPQFYYNISTAHGQNEVASDHHRTIGFFYLYIILFNPLYLDAAAAPR